MPLYTLARYVLSSCVCPSVTSRCVSKQPSAILDLSGTYRDHPQRLLGNFNRCAKFGWNGCSTFDNMKVLIFYAFGLKTPIHAPKIGVLGEFDSLSREQY